MNIDCWTRDLVFFVMQLNLEQQFADYREKALTNSGHFYNKILVAEVGVTEDWKC